MTKSEVENAKTELHCSFCGTSQSQIRKLIAGPNVFICNECVVLCVGIVEESMSEARSAPKSAQGDPSTPSTGFCCSFCGLNQSEVNKLITGPSGVICDECVAVCAEIVNGEPVTEKDPVSESDSGIAGSPNIGRSCSFCGKSRYEVKQLFAGPNVQICEECVALYIGILYERNCSPLITVERG